MVFLPETVRTQVVLVEPDIPQNTGNITRLCACTGAGLYLVGQLGFRLSDRFLNRAAMDYRQQVQPVHLPTFSEVTQRHPQAMPFYLSSKGTRSLWDVTFPDDALLVFGSETTGLPEAFLAEQPPQQVLRIPMVAGARSLNLANAVAIVLYERLRQHQPQ